MAIIKTESLTPAAYNIIINKATERPNTGKFTNYSKSTLGTYLCRQCGLALFRSDDKFISSCGWPSFDAEINDNVKKILDKDKIRTEILCARCDGHLGHIFHGEYITSKNTRYCVNSLSIDFVKNNINILDTEEIILAAGCFWGVEYLLQQQPGIVYTEVGYTGDEKAEPNPDYNLVCSGRTKYIEAVRVIFDPKILNFTSLIKLFFEIHDFSQSNGQGPDIGLQYLSRIFYYDQDQQAAAQTVVSYLIDKNFKVATVLEPVTVFWPAEDYHQEYYLKNQKQPYCHIRKQIFF